MWYSFSLNTLANNFPLYNLSSFDLFDNLSILSIFLTKDSKYSNEVNSPLESTKVLIKEPPTSIPKQLLLVILDSTKLWVECLGKVIVNLLLFLDNDIWCSFSNNTSNWLLIFS